MILWDYTYEVLSEALELGYWKNEILKNFYLSSLLHLESMPCS